MVLSSHVELRKFGSGTIHLAGEVWRSLAPRLNQALAWVVALGLFWVSLWGQALPSSPGAGESVWGSRPVLSYLLLTPSLYSLVLQEGVLSQAQFQTAQSIARQENEKLGLLEQESRAIILDPQLTLRQKQARIVQMGYNQRLMAIVVVSRQALGYALDVKSYRRLVNWIERRWQIERRLHGSLLAASNPRSYSIFATRYDSKGAYTVALPDKCLKFSNAGNHICDSDGYSVGQGYSVFISYEKGVGVTVGESGPWNVDDNYWSRLSDPQPRRMFADLGLGMPEAQAAYFNGYNGGQDQFGRKVTAPFGIDLARQVSIDIGLQPGVNDWITISFMWTAGWDGGAPAATLRPGETALPPSTSQIINPVQTATPNPDGSIVHVVQPNEALWSIAIAYQTTIQSIRVLNKLSESTVIIPGQKLVIRAAGPTPASGTALGGTPPVGVTQTLTMTATSTFVEPVRTSTLAMTAAPVGGETPGGVALSSSPTSIVEEGDRSQEVDPILILITILVVGGTILMLVGLAMARKP